MYTNTATSRDDTANGLHYSRRQSDNNQMHIHNAEVYRDLIQQGADWAPTVAKREAQAQQRQHQEQLQRMAAQQQQQRELAAQNRAAATAAHQQQRQQRQAQAEAAEDATLRATADRLLQQREALEGGQGGYLQQLEAREQQQASRRRDMVYDEWVGQVYQPAQQQVAANLSASRSRTRDGSTSGGSVGGPLTNYYRSYLLQSGTAETPHISPPTPSSSSQLLQQQSSANAKPNSFNNIKRRSSVGTGVQTDNNNNNNSTSFGASNNKRATNNNTLSASRNNGLYEKQKVKREEADMERAYERLAHEYAEQQYQSQGSVLLQAGGGGNSYTSTNGGGYDTSNVMRLSEPRATNGGFLPTLSNSRAGSANNNATTTTKGGSSFNPYYNYYNYSSMAASSRASPSTDLPVGAWGPMQLQDSRYGHVQGYYDDLQGGREAAARRLAQREEAGLQHISKESAGSTLRPGEEGPPPPVRFGKRVDVWL